MSLLTIQIPERNLMPGCMPWTEAISRKEIGVDEEMDIKQQKRKITTACYTMKNEQECT